MDIYARAVEQWGVAAQVQQAMEEMGECIAALNQYFYRGRINKDALAKEIADVELMMYQLRYIIGHSVVEDAKALKIARLEERLQRHLDQQKERGEAIGQQEKDEKEVVREEG